MPTELLAAYEGGSQSDITLANEFRDELIALAAKYAERGLSNERIVAILAGETQVRRAML